MIAQIYVLGAAFAAWLVFAYLIYTRRIWRRWPWLAKMTRCQSCKFIGTENDWPVVRWVYMAVGSAQVSERGCRKCKGPERDNLELLDELEVAVWKGQK